MINWFKYLQNIPARIKIGKNTYEILWISEFKDKEQVGESRFSEEKQILIKIGQSNKESVHTYFHEVLHAISEEYSVNLTENQVLNFEKALKDIIRDNNLWKKEVKSASNERKRKNFKRLRKISKKTK